MFFFYFWTDWSIIINFATGKHRIGTKRTESDMAGIKDRIEFFFEQLARVLYTHRFKTLLLLFLFVGAVFYKLPALTVDTNSEALLKDDDPKKIIYNAFRDQFGQDRMILVAITADHIFSENFLKN